MHYIDQLLITTCRSFRSKIAERRGCSKKHTELHWKAEFAKKTNYFSSIPFKDALKLVMTVNTLVIVACLGLGRETG